MDYKLFAVRLSRLLVANMPFGQTANEVLVLVSKVNSSQRDLDKQVEEALKALTTSTELISRLETSLEARAIKLNELKDEYDRVSKLAEMTEAQGDAVAKTLEKALGKGQKRERWFALAINLIAGIIIFVIGVFLSDWVQGIPEFFGLGVENTPIEVIPENSQSDG